MLTSGDWHDMLFRRRDSLWKKKDVRVLRRLFASMFMISAFTFGGGFVISSLMKKKFVDEYGWLSEQEMLDYTALAQSCPGAIAVIAAMALCGAISLLAGILFGAV